MRKYSKRVCACILTMAFALLTIGCQEEDKRGITNSSIDVQTTADADKEETTEPVVASELWEDDDVNRKVKEINELIDNYFYFDVDREAQEEALYDGIMDGLDDPYSVYYTPEEYADLQEDTSGEYVGIGAVVTENEDMNVMIVRPIKDSPAEEVGLQAEDIIVEVDGTAITDQELSVVVDMIRGEEGTTAHLKIYRQGESDYLEFDVPRRVVENYTVSSEMLDEQVGYLEITQFNDNTAKEFIEAFEECQDKGAQAMIIDLRDNPGGLLTSVVEICDYIMDDGMIVYTEDKNGKVIGKFEDTGKHSVDIPLVVLVNGNSASASEIFSGAMQDTGKAEIVGTTTFGKGIVQSVIPLEDGSAVKMTIAKYFTPNGNDIHEKGIEPDVVVELPDKKTTAVNIERKDDTQLQKAQEIIAEKLK
ncbi:MAG: S41 family peptidase [Wujia sp.]